MKLASECKACGKHVVLECDDQCPKLNLEKWLPIIVCNRCGDYMERRRLITERIQTACNQVIITATLKNKSEPMAKLRENLIQLTQSFCQLLCRRWQTTNDWSDEMVDIIMESPDKASLALRAHEGLHRRAREKADSEQKERQHARNPTND